VDGFRAVRSCDTPIAAGVYIGEFVGELVTDDIAVKRAVLMNPSHSSSHLFALSHFAALPDSGRPYLSDSTSCPSPPTGPLFVIDAGRIANVSRFIRHVCPVLILCGCQIVVLQCVSMPAVLRTYFGPACHH
jgi:hypothetical protein